MACLRCGRSSRAMISRAQRPLPHNFLFPSVFSILPPRNPRALTTWKSVFPGEWRANEVIATCATFCHVFVSILLRRSQATPSSRRVLYFSAVVLPPCCWFNLQRLIYASGQRVSRLMELCRETFDNEGLEVEDGAQSRVKKRNNTPDDGDFYFVHVYSIYARYKI